MLNKEDKIEKQISRRKLLKTIGQATCGIILAQTTYKLFQKKYPDSTKSQRYMWQIDTQLCTACGKCQTSCIRTPSAVKAINDQVKCSNCVVCYGHISNKSIESEKIDSQGIHICPHNAVKRKNYSGGIDGYFTYTIDDKLCDACGKCVQHCNEHGTGSMFLLIRPDLCLGCNECHIAQHCPENAISRVPIASESDLQI